MTAKNLKRTNGKKEGMLGGICVSASTLMAGENFTTTEAHADVIGYSRSVQKLVP
jgi:hypothetical protein